MLRRIERDESAVDALITATDNPPSPSARLSELTLLGRGSSNQSKIRPLLERALRGYEAEKVPVIAFDVTSDTYRLAVQAIRELLS
jgi:hypothetical protein